MRVTSFGQKFLLVLLGLAGSVVLLEAGLRLGGMIAVCAHPKDSALTFQGTEFRILCIGESTTWIGGKISYPSQLQDILNAQNLGKNFIVINKGLVSKTSKDILKQLPENLAQYKPALVVAMLGINDRENPQARHWGGYLLRFFRDHSYAFRFFEFLSEHLRVKIAEKISGKDFQSSHDFSQNKLDDQAAEYSPQAILKNIVRIKKEQEFFTQYLNYRASPSQREGVQKTLQKLKTMQYLSYLDIIEYYCVMENFDLAKYFLQNAAGLFPDNYINFYEYGVIYKAEKKYDIAVEFFKKALALRPQAVFPKVQLADCYDALGEKQKALELYSTLTQLADNPTAVNQEVARRLAQYQDYKQAAGVYTKVLRQSPSSPQLDEEIADNYSNLGDLVEAKFFRAKAKDLKKNFLPLPQTIENYKKIADMVHAKGAVFICMQYPLRSIKPLKAALKSRDFVLFAENKKNFETALAQASADKYFSDFFAGDFGHCTARGNHLIAEHLTAIIKDKVLYAHPALDKTRRF